METKVYRKDSPLPLKEGGHDLLQRGYALMRARRPSEAMDLFSKARRMLTGDEAYQAAIYEARCYFYLGQLSEGRILINEVLKEQLSIERRGHALLVRAVLDKDHPQRALASLAKIDFPNVSIPLQANILIKRGRIYSETNRLDDSLVDYAGAAALFESVEDFEGSAHAFNNQASIFRKLKRYADAHESVDKALSLITSENPSQFQDQKAKVYLAEEKFIEAERWARQALQSVEATDLCAFQVEALCTLAQTAACQDKYNLCAESFARAKRIAKSLDSDELMFQIVQARKENAELFLKRLEVELIELALKISNNSYRQAGQKLGMSHTAVMKSMRRKNLCCKPQRPRSIICKPIK